MRKTRKKKKYLIKKNSNKPFFSVITVVKNAENDVVKTIKSIKKQSYKKFEYIVIDGKSNDNTVKNILKFKKNINLFISENDKGIYFAMNKALDYVKGEVIVFINAGDTFTKNALYKIYNKFKKNYKIDFIFGTVRRHYLKDTILKYGFSIERLRYNFDFATAHSTGFFIKTSSMRKLGRYNTIFKHSADYDLYYRALIKKKFKGDYTSKKDLIGIFSSGGYSSKVSFIDQLIEETKIRIHNQQNLPFVILIFVNAILKKIIKNLFK